MKGIMQRLVKEEEGQGLVEYALIIALVALAVVAALLALGNGITGIFNDINDELYGAN